MNPQVKQIANRIKELREILELSKEELAGKVGISAEQYDIYERAGEDIPIGVLYGLAACMNVDPTVLLSGDMQRMAEYTIVRGGKGVQVERYEGYDFTSLAYNFQHRQMEPMIVHVSSAHPELITHGGQEFNYILSGTVKLVIGKREFVLRAGDSIYFNPAIPHGQQALDGDATFLTVINE